MTITDEQIKYWANAIWDESKDRVVADMARELLAARAVAEAVADNEDVLSTHGEIAYAVKAYKETIR